MTIRNNQLHLFLNNGYGRGKRKGNLKAVACEALEERYCSDVDYDPTKTEQNVYEGITSGEELTRVITEEAEAYSEQQKANGKRALRKDAIIGFACIVKPSEDFIDSLSEEEKERFWEDSNYVMRDILGDSNIKSRVRHKDEGAEHEHYFGMPYTKDGRLCGKEFFSLKTYKRFNAEYPRRMRACGWDIDDCIVYDEEQAATDEGYKARHIQSKKEKKHGLSSAKYKANKDRERIADLEEETSFLRDRVQEKREIIEQQNAEMAKMRQQLQAYKDRETMSKRSEQAEQQTANTVKHPASSRFDRTLY